MPSASWRALSASPKIRVNHRALCPSFVRDRRHDLVQIDLLERLQREARVFVQEELRLGKSGSRVPLLEIAIELRQRFFATFGVSAPWTRLATALRLFGVSERPKGSYPRRPP